MSFAPSSRALARRARPGRAPVPREPRLRAPAGSARGGPGLRLVVLALSAALLGGLLVAPAGAQDIDALRRRAEQLADELKGLEQQASIADEDYLVVLDRIDSVRAESATTQAAVAEAQTRVDAVRAEVSTYLVTSYMEAGSTTALMMAGNSDINQTVNQQVLLDTLRGDRLQLSEDIAAVRSDLDAREAELAAQQVELAELEGQAKEAKEHLESLVGEQQALYDSASAELREAVAAEQRRREEEAARKAAEEMARLQAEAAAAAQRQAAAAAAAAAQRQAAAAAPTKRATAAPAPAPAGPEAGPGVSDAPAPPAPAPPPPDIPPNSGAEGAIAAAKSQLGRPYRWGGTSPATGFDCSGLMLWSWAQVGVSLPRTSRAQYAGTQRVPISELQPGDLVFSGNPIHHVGMYIGGGQMIHSPHTGDVVKITSINYMGNLAGGGRIG